MKKQKTSAAPANTGAADLSVFTQFEHNSWRKKDLKQNTGEECALAYTRVSSKEQFMTNGSIETQLKLVDGLSASMKVPIEDYFGGTYESAKSEERKEFQRMMNFIAKSKKNIKYIFVSDHDRFSRTGGNAIHIMSQLRLKQIQLVAASSPLNTLNPSGAFQQDLLLLMSAHDNVMRKEKCVRGMKQKYEKGIFFGRPPLGYDCIRQNGESKIVINEKGKLLAKAFRWKAEGKQSSVQIAKKLHRLGINVSDKKLSWIFKNVFYCGLLNNKLLDTAVIEGKNWEPLISRQIFLKANEVLATNRTKFENHKEDDAIPLRHLIHCEKCKKPLTAYIVKKKNLYYYKCNTKGCKSNKSAKDVHNGFERLLDQFKIEPKYLNLITKQLKLSFIKLDQSLKEKQGDNGNRKKQLQQKIDKLEERFINEEITKDLYDKFRKKYEAELQEINGENSDNQINLSNLEILISKAIEKTQNLSQYWVSASFYKKQAIQKAVFPDKIYLHTEKGTYRTTKVNEALTLMSSLARVSGDNKKGNPSKKSKDSHRVDLVGIEPTSG